MPARARGVELCGDVEGSGYRRPPALARRADGQTIQLTPLLYRLLELVDGRRDHAELAAALGAGIGRRVEPEDVRFLLDEKLRPLGVLRLPDGSEPRTRKADPLLGLKPKVVVTNPAVTGRIAAPFAWLFRPGIVAATTVAFVAMTFWMAFEKGLASAARQALYEPGLLLLVLVLTVLSAGFHELGHAAASRYGGARPGTMGMGLYLVWPAFYTDVSESYRLGRAGRLRVDLGGLYFNAIFALGILGVWALVRADALLLVIAAQLVQMVRQLVPIVRFDGYHVLADLTGVPDLFHHIRPTLARLVPWRRGRPDAQALKPWARRVVTVWVLLVVPILLLLLVGLVLVLPRLAATAWDSLGLHADALAANWGNGDPVAVALGVFSLVGIALPVLGIAYLLARVTRRTALAAWRASAGSTPLRAGVALAGAAIAFGVGWAWWPDGQYRPIEANEEWTAAEAPQAAAVSGPPVHAPPPAPAAQAAASGAEGRGGNGRWILALVPAQAAGPPAAVPAQSGPPNAWPFPFDPPEAPGEGDNQALAINTRDNTTRVATALALVWVEDGADVDNRNEAWALASCKNCRTLAVAFQVVLVLGQSNVQIPENAAVAVNYDCETCVTHALASQLVATLTRPPSEATMRELDRIWKEVRKASKRFRLLPLTEIRAQLAAAQAAILAVLAAEGAEEAASAMAEAEATTPAPDGGDEAPPPKEEEQPAEPEPVRPEDEGTGATATVAEENEPEPGPEPAPAPTEPEEPPAAPAEDEPPAPEPASAESP